jgi:hypothetical protein
LDLGFELIVVMPFLKVDYENDFQEDASKSEFRALCTSAASILEIEGERGPKGVAYEHSGQSVVDASDILIAVWDGKESAGRGGTTDLLQEAAQKGMPVIRIDTMPGVPMRLHWRDPGGRRAHQAYFDEEFSLTAGSQVNELIETVIDNLVRPPRFASEQRSMQVFLDQRFKRLNLNAPFPLLMALLGIRRPRAADFIRKPPEEAAREFAAEEGYPANLAEGFVWADDCAVYFGQAFRSAFILNFFFSALVTILVALELPPPASAIEIGLVIFLVYNTTRGRKGRWHELWIEAREVAERLRLATLIHTVGSRPSLPFGDAPAWTTWYVRAMVREAGLRNAVLDQNALTALQQAIISLLRDQRAYHQATARRFKALHDRLAGVGKWLFYFTLSISITAFVITWFVVHDVPHDVRRWIFVFSAGLPALGAASYGVRVIGDFDGTAARSSRMVVQLEGLIRGLHSSTPSFESLRDIGHRAAEILQGDVASWRLVVESRELDMPG